MRFKFAGAGAIQHLKRPEMVRHCPAIANCSNNFIVVTGGSPPTNIQSRFDSIDIYSLASEEWLPGERLPRLNQARQSHSSCALNGFVYIFGGDNASINLLDSLERLYVGQSEQSFEATTRQWELL